MNRGIMRPAFVEGQVLTAADLEALGTRGRFDSAAHERSEHLWGVAQGLAIVVVKKAQDNQGNAYVELAIQPGVAVAANGRRIVVPEQIDLGYVDFRAAGVYAKGDTKDTPFPVYLVAIEAARPSLQPGGVCAAAATTRVEELYQVEYGRPGSEEQVLNPTTSVGPGATPDPRVKVLVGFVTWTEDAFKGQGGGRFNGVASASSFGAIRYAGVRASTIAGHAGSVVVKTREGDPRFVLSMVEDGSGGCDLSFGFQQGTGAPTTLFSVDEKGNVTFAGKISPALAPATVAAGSGIISHGLTVPLPPGVDQAAVDAGRYQLHVTVRPTFKTRWINGQLCQALPVLCSVNADRVVTSVTCWYVLALAPLILGSIILIFLGPVEVLVEPSSCEYQIIAIPS